MVKGKNNKISSFKVFIILLFFQDVIVLLIVMIKVMNNFVKLNHANHMITRLSLIVTQNVGYLLKSAYKSHCV
jgi:hypothetical protein